MLVIKRKKKEDKGILPFVIVNKKTIEKEIDNTELDKLREDYDESLDAMRIHSLTQINKYISEVNSDINKFKDLQEVDFQLLNNLITKLDDSHTNLKNLILTNKKDTKDLSKEINNVFENDIVDLSGATSTLSQDVLNIKQELISLSHDYQTVLNIVDNKDELTNKEIDRIANTKVDKDVFESSIDNLAHQSEQLVETLNDNLTHTTKTLTEKITKFELRLTKSTEQNNLKTNDRLVKINDRVNKESDERKIAIRNLDRDIKEIKRGNKIVIDDKFSQLNNILSTKSKETKTDYITRLKTAYDKTKEYLKQKLNVTTFNVFKEQNKEYIDSKEKKLVQSIVDLRIKLSEIDSTNVSKINNINTKIDKRIEEYTTLLSSKLDTKIEKDDIERYIKQFQDKLVRTIEGQPGKDGQKGADGQPGKVLKYQLESNYHGYQLRFGNEDGSWSPWIVFPGFNQFASGGGIGDNDDIVSSSHTWTSQKIRAEIDGLESALVSSAGVYHLPTYTEDSGNIILSDGTYVFAIDSDGLGPLEVFDIDEASYVLDEGTNYIFASYNNGSPIISVSSSASVINQLDIIPIYTIFKDFLGILRIVDWDYGAKLIGNKISDMLVRTERFKPEIGDFELGEDTGNIITLTDGYVWAGHSRISLGSVNSNTDIAYLWVNTSGVWTRSEVNTYNNTQYNDPITGLQPLLSNQYTVNWTLRSIASNREEIGIVLGTESYKLIEAQESSMPELPPGSSSNAMFVGRIIVKLNDPTAEQIDSAFTETFGFTKTSFHNNMIGKQGGNGSDEYYHLTESEHLSNAYVDSTTTANRLAFFGSEDTIDDLENWRVVEPNAGIHQLLVWGSTGDPGFSNPYGYINVFDDNTAYYAFNMHNPTDNKNWSVKFDGSTTQSGNLGLSTDSEITWTGSHTLHYDTANTQFEFSDDVIATNLSGNNTGDQDLSGYVPFTGSTSDVSLGGNLTITGNDFAVLEFVTNISTSLGALFATGSGATEYGGANSLNLINTKDYPIAIGTSNNVSMFITSGGVSAKVGIGTNDNTPAEKLEVNGNIKTNGFRTNTHTVLTAASPYSVTSEDHTIWGCANTGNVVIDMISPVGLDGQIFIIKNILNSNTVTLNPGSYEIDGSTTDIVIAFNESITIQARADSAWAIISRYTP